ncbi:MAG TPA: hypothetical protein VM491_00515 [Burkholderiaceae bacterium]|nr:hypothetical protein [Burkholderiaceae bacterium]
MLRVAIAWAALSAVYLMLAGRIAAVEVAAAAVAAAAALAVTLGARDPRRFAVAAHWRRIPLLARAAAAIATDCVRLAGSVAAIARQRAGLAGRFAALDFDAGAAGSARAMPAEGERAAPTQTGGADAAPSAGDRTDAGRRVLVTIAVSAAPNRYVVWIDPQRDRLHVHELVASQRTQATRQWPL